MRRFFRRMCRGGQVNRHKRIPIQDADRDVSVVGQGCFRRATVRAVWKLSEPLFDTDTFA